MKRAEEQYRRFLQTLDGDTRRILLNFLDKIEESVQAGSFGPNDVLKLRQAIEDLRSDYLDMLRKGMIVGVDSAKKVKAAEFAPFVAGIQRLLLAQGVPIAATSKMMELQHLVPVFGGGLDKKIINSVWNKVWPDALNVDDRVKLLSERCRVYTENTIKQGISEGKSAYNIMRDLRNHFEVEGLERKAAFRLAAHTTNMTYQAAQAEISVQAKFVMGIRILRGVFGTASEQCDICEEHGGPADGPGKEYYKSDFGGNDADIYVLANMPGYHPNCNCGIETIYEDARQFLKNALTGSNDKTYEGGWVLTPTPEKSNLDITDKQLGKKAGKHMSEFGLSPGNQADRTAFQNYIIRMTNNPDEVRAGSWRGQTDDNKRGNVLFYLKGNDVVVTKPNNEFITILKDGLSNQAVQQASKTKR